MVDGTCSPAFQPLSDLLAENLESGADVGAAVAVVHDGELVVDVWGGQARPGVPWQRDTVVQVWSITKTMAGLTTLMLADQGHLNLDAPVADYWPAFAAGGKGAVRVRDVLGHTSGVPGWSRQISVAECLDLELSEGYLAEQELWYAPGQGVSAYQLIDHGHLLDGIVRGAVGSPLADVFHEQIAGPLGGGFHLGVPDEALGTVADLLPPPPSTLDLSLLPSDNFLLRTIANPLLTAEVCNDDEWRRGAVGGAGGHGNARGVARIQALVSHGGEVDGVRVLEQGTLDRIWEVQADGTDQLLMVPMRFGIGYGLATPSAPAVPDRDGVCWWTGYGGAIVVNDARRRFTIAYTPNQLAEHLVSSPRTDGYVRTAFECLEALA